ncbi:MAG: hypothetical protein ACKVUT_09680 [Gaiella sp.]
MSLRSLTVAAVATLTITLAVGAAAHGASQVGATLTGIEVIPVSSTRGTFVGVASGGVRAAWRAQIVHEELRTGPRVAITGGTFQLLLDDRRLLRGPVTGGSVTVLDNGSGCRHQRYRVETVAAIGTFTGTLTHLRRSAFGRCLVYGATIAGRGAFSVAG